MLRKQQDPYLFMNKKKSRVNVKRLAFFVLIIVMFCLIMVNLVGLVFGGENGRPFWAAPKEVLKKYDEYPIESWINSSFDMASVLSPNVFLMRVDDGRIYLDQGGYERTYPASMTKVMTTLVVIDAMPDLDQWVTADSSIFPYLTATNSSVAGINPGEQLTARDMLYAAMLPSGGDACLALANHIAGSEEAFVELMNQKAQSLGLLDTHFVNSTGLHDDNHYSTGRDIAALTKFALENETFKEVFTAYEYNTGPTNYRMEGMKLFSYLFAKAGDPHFEGGRLLGGKTGYTGQAGQCLVTLAQKHGSYFILVTMGAPGSPYTEPYHIIDHFNIYGNYLQMNLPNGRSQIPRG